MAETSKISIRENESTSSSRCVYCHGAGPFTDEHVLARAFAGPGENWVLTDLVCAKCNKLFSTYERSWTSAPGEAMARICFGPSGRKRRGVAYQTHPSNQIFLTSDADPIAYEVDILQGLEPRFRPQIIMGPNGLFPRAPDEMSLTRFKKALDLFLNNRELTVQKRLSNSFRVAVFSASDDFLIDRIEARSQPAGAWLDRFPSMDKVTAHPRVSVDAHGRLRIRATSMKEAGKLMQAILAQKTFFASEGSIEGGDYTIAFRAIHHIPKVNRAVSKTIVNYAVDQFGPEWIGAKEFRSVLDYCLKLENKEPKPPFVGILDQPTGLRAIDEVPSGRHALALACGRGRVIGLVRLYGTITYRVDLGPAPTGTPQCTKAVWIDYNGSGREYPTHMV